MFGFTKSRQERVDNLNKSVNYPKRNTQAGQKSKVPELKAKNVDKYKDAPKGFSRLNKYIKRL